MTGPLPDDHTQSNNGLKACFVIVLLLLLCAVIWFGILIPSNALSEARSDTTIRNCYMRTKPPAAPGAENVQLKKCLDSTNRDGSSATTDGYVFGL